MVEDIIEKFGYLGLFVVSFLAATLLPFSSEAVVVMMKVLGYNTWMILMFATTGNYLGALTNYYVGKWGSNFLFSRYTRVKPETLQKAQKLYGRWGAPVLFFSWVPVIGDPLAVIAGTLNVNLSVFTFWVILGKAIRYIFVLRISSAVQSVM